MEEVPTDLHELFAKLRAAFETASPGSYPQLTTEAEQVIANIERDLRAEG